MPRDGAGVVITVLALIPVVLPLAAALSFQAWATAGAADRGLNVEPDRREEDSR